MTGQRWNPCDRGDARALELLFRFLVNPNVARIRRVGSSLAIPRVAQAAGFVEFAELEWQRWATDPLGPIVSVAYDANTRTLYFANNDFRRRAAGDWHWTECELDNEWAGAHARAIELGFEREVSR